MAGKTGTAKKKAAPKKKEKKAKDNEDAGDEDMDDDAIQEEEAITKMGKIIGKKLILVRQCHLQGVQKDGRRGIRKNIFTM